MSSMEIPFLPKGRPPQSPYLTHGEESVDTAPDPSLSYKHGRRQGRSFSAATRSVTILLALLDWDPSLFNFLNSSGRSHPLLTSTGRKHWPQILNLCNCGHTIDEPLTRQCVHESLATAWLPLLCRDNALAAEFNWSGPGSDGSWPYYADANGTIPIGKARIALLGDGKRSFWSLRE